MKTYFVTVQATFTAKMHLKETIFYIIKKTSQMKLETRVVKTFLTTTPLVSLSRIYLLTFSLVKVRMPIL